jgi:dTDP-4-dehydrorhamnose 3,5-epimerase
MIVTETRLGGAFTIDVEPIADERGFFARSWSAQELSEHGLNTVAAQASIAFNEAAGTVRGMHWQVAPHAEVKLVRCTRGAIYDVIVDLRLGSPTFGEWIGIELTAENRRALYVPEYFAHGYQTLAARTEVWYQMSARYAPEAARGFRWDDERFGIEWPPARRRVISEPDQRWPAFHESALEPLPAGAASRAVPAGSPSGRVPGTRRS